MIKKVGDIIEKIVLAFIAALMGIMICVTVVAVIQRYLVGHSFNWVEEFCSYILIWVTFMGVAVSYRHFDLVLLNLFTQMLPKKAQAILELIVHLCCMALIAYIGCTSLKYGLSLSVFMRKSTTLGFSMFVPFSSLPIGFALMFLFSLENIPDMLHKIKTGEALKNALEG